MHRHGAEVLACSSPPERYEQHFNVGMQQQQPGGLAQQQKHRSSPNQVRPHSATR